MVKGQCGRQADAEVEGWYSDTVLFHLSTSTAQTVVPTLLNTAVSVSNFGTMGRGLALKASDYMAIVLVSFFSPYLSCISFCFVLFLYKNKKKKKVRIGIG